MYNAPFEVETFDDDLVAIRFGHRLRPFTVALRPAQAESLAERLTEVAADVGASPSTGAAVEETGPRHPAVLTFKHEDVAEDGEPIGPIFVSDDAGVPFADVWVTRSDARQIAAKQGLRFEED